jgi:hypothetical protein
MENHEKLPPTPTYGPSQPLKFITASNQWYGSLKPSDMKVEASVVAKILDGTEALFIFGYIEYADTFEKAHKSRFAYRMIFGEGDASEQYYPDGPDPYWEYN